MLIICTVLIRHTVLIFPHARMRMLPQVMFSESELCAAADEYNLVKVSFFAADLLYFIMGIPNIVLLIPYTTPA